MVRTSSTMLPLGTKAPDFELVDAVSGKPFTLASFSAKQGLVVAFLCSHCPFVKHLRAGLASFARDYTSKPLGIIAISSNDAEAYPADAPDGLAKEARAAGWSFPVLFDASQAVAKAYTAACTPDFFLFDAQRKLVYRGQFDASRPDNGIPVTGSDLRAASDALLAGRPIATGQRPSLGCNIKWKPGNEPVYFPPR